MPDKWADFLISGVRYNAEETHIDQVQSHIDEGDSVGPTTRMPRTRVVELLEEKKTFSTITKGTDGKWNRGALVQIVRVNGTKFIRTDADRTASDNLGSLPRF
jgi:Protein of unknown function (DUF3892)